MDYKWIAFTEHETAGKTKKYFITNKESGSVIGEIKWYGAWRKYCFFPVPEIVTIFETDCLTDIISFLNKLMIQWKAEQQQKKQNQH